MHRFIPLLLALLSWSALAGCAAPSAELSATELEAIVEDWREEADVRGVVVALQTPTELMTVASGEVVTDSGVRAVEGDDRFDIYSITKTFVAAEVLLLRDQGRLSLEDPAGKYAPELPFGEAITIRDLLGHRSGLIDYRDVPEYWAEFLPDLDRVWTWDESVRFAVDQGLLFEPGADYSYADTNYVILGHIIEVVTGTPLGEQLQRSLLDPLELGRTELRDERPISYLYGEFPCTDLARAVLDPDLAASLQATYCGGRDFIAVTDLPRTAIDTSDSGASGMVSSVTDLVRWSTALFGGDVVDAVEDMLPNDGSHYGLGIASTETPIGDAFGHVGGGGFGEARLWHLPDHNLTLVAWASREGKPNLGSLVTRVMLAYGDRPGGEGSGGEGDEGTTAIDLDATIALLADENSVKREGAAVSLVNAGSFAIDSSSALVDRLQAEPVDEVRSTVALALGSVARESNSAEVIRALGEALRGDGSDLVRKRAALALGGVGSDASVVLAESRSGQSQIVLEAIDAALERLGTG